MSTKALTTAAFFRKFPDDETCLNHLFEVRFGQGFECPKCERPSKWFRIKAERAYSCQWCGHHLHPTVGTPFEKTRTPLQLWFYAIHLFTTTRHGVSSKELERQLGVTYKTAWRMTALIRQHMADVDGERPIGGPGTNVEIDETLVGGVKKGKHMRGSAGKTVVVGALERGGDLITARGAEPAPGDPRAVRAGECRDWRDRPHGRAWQLREPCRCRLSPCPREPQCRGICLLRLSPCRDGFSQWHREFLGT